MKSPPSIKELGPRKWKEMREAGINISQWARDNGFTRDVVMSVLRGQCSCLHGEAHKVAVALGLKKGVIVKPGTYCPAPQAVDGRQLASPVGSPQ